MLENLKNCRLVLASNSPRRKELLAALGVSFEVRTIGAIAEDYPATLCGEDIPRFIAREKAAAYLPTLSDDELLVTADTIVYLPTDDGTTASQNTHTTVPCAAPGVVLGKPRDDTDAARMLHLLSGRVHQVITGVCLATRDRQRDFAVTSYVRFAALTDEEIDYYVSHFHPLDKAGAYGIQEWIGLVAVTSLQGSYFNVMGLPVQRLYAELKAW